MYGVYSVSGRQTFDEVCCQFSDTRYSFVRLLTGAAEIDPMAMNELVARYESPLQITKAFAAFLDAFPEDAKLLVERLKAEVTEKERSESAAFAAIRNVFAHNTNEWLTKEQLASAANITSSQLHFILYKSSHRHSIEFDTPPGKPGRFRLILTAKEPARFGSRATREVVQEDDIPF